MNENLKKLIDDQRGNDRNSILFNLGCQILDIAEESDFNADLIEKDIQTSGMGLPDLKKELDKYAAANRKNQTVFCITPMVADGIIRKFYGIPERETETHEKSAEAAQNNDFIELTDFL